VEPRNLETSEQFVMSPGRYVAEVRAEVSRITWPTRRETLTATARVFALALCTAIFFFATDSVVSQLTQLILQIDR
jgi:preprotein translocase subunit SecE